MGYYSGFEYEKRKDDGVVVSVLVSDLHIQTIGELGKIEVENFGRGIFRIYKDIKRVEFKQFGGEYDGRVFGWAWDCVKTYAYQPAKSSTLN